MLKTTLANCGYKVRHIPKQYDDGDFSTTGKGESSGSLSIMKSSWIFHLPNNRGDYSLAFSYARKVIVQYRGLVLLHEDY